MDLPSGGGPLQHSCPPGPMSQPRRGVTVVETLVALTLLFLLTGLLVQLLAGAGRSGRQVSNRLEVVEARRVARDLVDLSVRSGGSLDETGRALGLRSYVGHGEPCPGGGFVYRGRRLPDPGRDSLWLMAPDGTWTVEAATSLTSAACVGSLPGPALPGFALDAGVGPAAGVILVRVFEAGRFTLTDALRYGRVGTRAQPLTAPVLDPTRSFVEVGGGRVRLSVVGWQDTIGMVRSWSVR